MRIFSYDVDYQSRLQPSDALEVIYSAEGEAEGAEILYAALSLGGSDSSLLPLPLGRGRHGRLLR